jgi:hypothetical protein
VPPLLRRRNQVSGALPLFGSDQIRFAADEGAGAGSTSLPLFFKRDDLRAAWLASGGKADAMPPVQVTDLRTLAWQMQYDISQDWRPQRVQMESAASAACPLLPRPPAFPRPAPLPGCTTHAHMHMHTCTHATCTHAHMLMCMCMCMYHAHMHTCTHAHMHTCTHAHMHTCTHAHIHMHSPIPRIYHASVRRPLLFVAPASSIDFVVAEGGGEPAGPPIEAVEAPEEAEAADAPTSKFDLSRADVAGLVFGPSEGPL